MRTPPFIHFPVGSIANIQFLTKRLMEMIPFARKDMGLQPGQAML
jgi:hypothetical protein